MRKCNDCTLCCKLLPVAEINKPVHTPCSQQRSTGCRVYGTRAFPRACHLWSCLWLLDDSLPLQRPDRARYVIDPSPDFCTINGQKISVLQVWVDPRFPNSHRDPALRAWLAQRWVTHGQLGLARFDTQLAIVLFPPAFSGGDHWIEAGGTGSPEEHSTAEIVQAYKEIKERDSDDRDERRERIEQRIQAAIGRKQ